MPEINDDIAYFAETSFRNMRKRFGIKTDDRRRHVYIVGKTGMGKTVLEENMVIQDIKNGHGVGVVDPHGEFAEKMLDFVPSHRVNDVVYFNPADLDNPIGFNVMEKVDASHRHLVAAGVMGVFKKIWVDVWSARMEYILNNAILALLEYPGATLLGINRMLADKSYREKVLNKVTDSEVRAFWLTEYAKYAQQYASEATAAIQNKVGQFISAPLIRNIIGQTKSSFNIRKAMDERKIIIMNISKGRIGEDNSRLLGAMLITKIYLAAMERVDVPEEKRADFYLYVDEFQNFASDSFANILSEARKYHLCLTLAHQYIAQMDEKVRDAVFGNVGTLISFRVGAEDGEALEKEFSPEFLVTDLVSLTKYNIYLKLMIDGVSGRAFSAYTLPPFPIPEKSSREKIIMVSRERYGMPRKSIEEKIIKWRGFLPEGPIILPPDAPPPPKLYDATCSKCGKNVKVVFEPDPKRPVYCEKCLKEVRSQKASSQQNIPIQRVPESPKIIESKNEPISKAEDKPKSFSAFEPQRQEIKIENRPERKQPFSFSQKIESNFPRNARKEFSPFRKTTSTQSNASKSFKDSNNFASRPNKAEGKKYFSSVSSSQTSAMKDLSYSHRALPRELTKEIESKKEPQQKNTGNDPQNVSLEEAIKKEPVYFNKPPKEARGGNPEKKERVGVDLTGLRKVLAESLIKKDAKVSSQKLPSDLPVENNNQNIKEPIQELFSKDEFQKNKISDSSVMAEEKKESTEESNNLKVLKPGERIKF